MRRGKLIIGVLCCFLTPFAFSIKAYAMNFDAEQIYESVFVVYSGNYIGSGFGNTSEVQLYSYNGEIYRAGIYLIDNAFDIAILSVENSDFVPIDMGDDASIKTGDDIYAMPQSMQVIAEVRY